MDCDRCGIEPQAQRPCAGAPRPTYGAANCAIRPMLYAVRRVPSGTAAVAVEVSTATSVRSGLYGPRSRKECKE